MDCTTIFIYTYYGGFCARIRPTQAIYIRQWVTHAEITQKFKMAAVKPEIHASTFVHGTSKRLSMIATKFQRLYPCFWGQVTRKEEWEYFLMSGYVVNQRWRPLTGNRYEITYISARIHDSNDISTATPIFSRSSNSVELVSILPDVNGSRKFNMAAVMYLRL